MGGGDGIVIAGDFNLVGSPDPLTLMAAELDFDGTGLKIASSLQLDGRSNVTWSDAAQPFGPGRLDYLLYSGSTLKLLGSFVLDSRDVEPRWRDTHGLDVNDTDLAADHLPIVADLMFR